MSEQYAVGVDLGGTSVKAALVERSAGAVRRAQLPTEAANGPDHVIGTLAEAVREVCAGHSNGEQIVGVGIGSPGFVSLDRTTVIKPPNFPGWDRIDLAGSVYSALRDLRLDRESIVVDNDANVAGLGSAFYGAGIPFDHFVMVTLGTGVGGAIIFDKQVFRGANGGAGEIGHMTIDYEGPYARSGVAGAAEAYLGQHFLSRHARYKLLTRPSRLHDMTGADLSDLSPMKLHHAALAGDPAAIEVLAWAGHKLGVVLGSMVNLLDIRKVVVGGGVSAAGDFLIEPARETMRRFVTPGLSDDVEIVRETLGNEVALLGAARLAFERHDQLASPNSADR